MAVRNNAYLPYFVPGECIGGWSTRSVSPNSYFTITDARFKSISMIGFSLTWNSSYFNFFVDGKCAFTSKSGTAGSQSWKDPASSRNTTGWYCTFVSSTDNSWTFHADFDDSAATLTILYIGGILAE